jgi:hypothetical protein
MITATHIKHLLLTPLAPIFGSPKSVDAIAAELAKHVPNHATEDSLEQLASRLIQTRKAKSFPSAAELIAAVRGIPDHAKQSTGDGYDATKYAEEGKREWQGDQVVKGLRGTPLAHQAIEEGWAVGLTNFAREHLRAPAFNELPAIKRLVAQNDSVYEDPGYLAGLVQLRHDMHDHAKRELT